MAFKFFHCMTLFGFHILLNQKSTEKSSQINQTCLVEILCPKSKYIVLILILHMLTCFYVILSKVFSTLKLFSQVPSPKSQEKLNFHFKKLIKNFQKFSDDPTYVSTDEWNIEWTDRQTDERTGLMNSTEHIFRNIL
jgi:hypothetical protein